MFALPQDALRLHTRSQGRLRCRTSRRMTVILATRVAVAGPQAPSLLRASAQAARRQCTTPWAWATSTAAADWSRLSLCQASRRPNLLLTQRVLPVEPDLSRAGRLTASTGDSLYDAARTPLPSHRDRGQHVSGLLFFSTVVSTDAYMHVGGGRVTEKCNAAASVKHHLRPRRNGCAGRWRSGAGN